MRESSQLVDKMVVSVYSSMAAKSPWYCKW